MNIMKEMVKVTFLICHQDHHYFIIQVSDELADLGVSLLSVCTQRVLFSHLLVMCQFLTFLFYYRYSFMGSASAKIIHIYWEDSEIKVFI